MKRIMLAGIVSLALVAFAPSASEPTYDCEEYMSGPFVEAACDNYDDAVIYHEECEQEYTCLGPTYIDGKWRVLRLE